ncbi:DUF2357 domain-containing protein [Pseudonocardia sp. MH-G8]|uniref:DUF2357 domain-containing protein n=1 Tax=Pseudonocardia sp. MH-G8 TaxID=1854588 RepID=UPI000BA0BA44|nr:DUF2357 domain-containing protein [Pseudonocardia sp. MH-G8]OZM79669.1 hypothetical protein CFP66_24160 [Pseudonocardia sp. MH-G8]
MLARTVRVILCDSSGARCGALVVADLPHKFTLMGGALREASIYTYEIIDVDGSIMLEPSELFDPDDETGKRGRLRPAQSVGRLTIAVETAAGDVLRGDIDVAPTKLEQTREYRRMLEDIAEHAAEAVLQGFAPASLVLEPSDLPAELLYNKFALLEARLESDEFTAAVARVLHQPDRGWESETELRPSGTGYPSGSAFGRALTTPGARRPWRVGRGALRTLPRHLPLERHEATYDTMANRFVKYAMERWRDMAMQMLDVLGQPSTVTPGPTKRGRAAASSVVELLDELLGHDLFRGVGRLTQIPTSNQVLLKRDGYRQLFRMFALIETAPALVFEHASIDDVYSASQRNIATLYEFWCYLVLADIVGRVCDDPKTAHAFSPRGNGLSLTLRTGPSSAIRWKVQRHGRDLEIELYFNRQFSETKDGISSDGSWTRAMRPDCSLHIRPVSDLPRHHGALDMWLHFDAKYRVEHLVEQLTSDRGVEQVAQADGANTSGALARSRREDLLKMHAYRDAIHRTAGAYVLYPGDVPVRVERYTELLPGLGAFPLRPDMDKDASGSGDLEQFLADVLTHVSDQASRHERERFWSGTINSDTSTISSHFSPAPFLDRPPADTDVLVGYIRSPEQRTWIEEARSYNVRADDRRGAVTLGGRELSAPLLLLYEDTPSGLQIVALGRTGSWRAIDRDELEQSGYPQPRGRLYFVAAFDTIVDLPLWLRRLDLGALRPDGASWGAPFTVSWWDLLHNASKG